MLLKADKNASSSDDDDDDRDNDKNSSFYKINNLKVKISNP